VPSLRHLLHCRGPTDYDGYTACSVWSRERGIGPGEIIRATRFGQLARTDGVVQYELAVAPDHGTGRSVSVLKIGNVRGADRKPLGHFALSPTRSQPPLPEFLRRWDDPCTAGGAMSLAGARLGALDPLSPVRCIANPGTRLTGRDSFRAINPYEVLQGGQSPTPSARARWASYARDTFTTRIARVLVANNTRGCPTHYITQCLAHPQCYACAGQQSDCRQFKT